MARQNTIDTPDATDQAVARATERQFIKAIFRKLVPGWFGHAPSQALKQIVGCDLRTAERYFAGDRTPDAIALMMLLHSKVGVRLVEAAVSEMPPAEAVKFWDEMERAAVRAKVRINNQATLDEDAERAPALLRRTS